MPRRRDQNRDQSRFSFVNASHPDEFRERELRNKIRRHAMGAVGELRRKLPRNPTIPVHMLSGMSDGDDKGREWQLKLNKQSVPRHLPVLAIHPVETDHRARQLIHFMQSASSLRHIPFRYEWYSLASLDPTPFYLYLANAALLYSQVTQQGDSRETAKYFDKCLSQVVERLGQETGRVSSGVMLTILGLACYETHAGHWNRRTLHLDALEQALKSQGGIEGLDHTLALCVFWFDNLDSTMQDCHPRYAVPKHLLVEPTHYGSILPSLGIITKTLRLSGSSRDIADVLEKFGALMNFLGGKARDDDIWTNSARAAELLIPISHSLLSTPRVVLHDHDEASSDHLMELTRLALLIVLAQLKQLFMFPYDELAPLLERFRLLLLRHHGSGLPDLELWCVTNVSLIDQAHTEEYVQHIDDAAEILGIWGSQKTLETVRGIIQVDQVLSLDIGEFVSRLDMAHRDLVLDQI